MDSRPPTSNSCIQFVRVDNLSTSALFHRVNVVCQQSITINVTEVLHYSSHIGNIPTRVRRHFNLGSAIDRRPSNQIFYRLHWSSTLIWMFSARCQVLLCSWVTVGFQKRRDQPGRRFTLSEKKTGQLWLLILLKTWLWGMAQGQNWKTIDTMRQLINPVWQVPVMCFHLSSFSWLPIVSRQTAVPWRSHAFFLQGSSTCTC